MSNIDKQWLQQEIADMEAARDEIPFGLDEEDSNTLAALRIALASLEAEAVAYTEKCEITNMQATGLYLRGFPDGSHGRDIALYTAPPAPVVPDAYIRDDRGRMILNGESEPRIGYGAGWNACRAAMLQGAEQQNRQQNIPENIPTLRDGLAAIRSLGEIDSGKIQAERDSLNSPVIPDAYDIEAFGIFSATEGENGLMLQIERFRFGTEKCPQIGKENMVPKFALQAIINRLQAHCDSMGEDALIDIFASSAEQNPETK